MPLSTWCRSSMASTRWSEIHAIVQGAPRRGAHREQIASIARSLDETGFLDSPKFAERQRAIEEAFRLSPTRPAAHAGGAYAGERGGPGGADRRLLHPRRRARVRPRAGGLGGVRGLLAPHIDFHRGGPTYAWAYREVIERSDADLFVILGTCHAGMADPFAATLKPYDTPLGAGAGRSRLLRRARPALWGRPPRLGGGASQRALDRVPGGDAPPSPGKAAPVHDPARARLVRARGRVGADRSRSRSARAAVHRRPRSRPWRRAAARRA